MKTKLQKTVPLEERLRVYLRMRELFNEKEGLSWPFLCVLLRSVSNGNDVKMFPEIWKHRPQDVQDHVAGRLLAWWPIDEEGIKTRKKVLNNAIRSVKRKLLIK